MRDKTEKAEQNTSSRKNGQPKNRVKTNISQGSTKEPKAADLTAALRSAAELNDVIHRFLRTRGAVFEAAAEAVAACLRDGGKIFLFGNGGSAAQAQPFAAELVNGLSRRDSPPLPAVALTTDMSALTAIGNDRGFAEVFGRQVEALGWPGDVALGLTTSGTSPNILEGLRGARAKGMITIAL
ncbi:MAG: SIS domain-containing protein, partial [Candidatus Aminicenantes bacterium]|nr:SIS domain-containing protein [Candidatus Aminicenantes bacterium]